MSSSVEKGSWGTGRARSARPALGNSSGINRLFSFSAGGRDSLYKEGGLVYSVLGEENLEPLPSPCIGEVYVHRLSGHVYISHLSA